MRRNFQVKVDGGGRTRYFIDGAETDVDSYIAIFFKDYGSVPTDANISLTVRQEADNAGQSTESATSSDFTSIASADSSNPGGVTGLPDNQLN